MSMRTRLVHIFRNALPFFAALVLLAVGVATTEYVALQARSDALNREKAHVFDDLSMMRARLEAAINATLHLSRGLVAYTATHPYVDDADFQRFAAEIIAGNPSIRNIALAPGNVIRFIHPVKGNERAIGLDYTRNKAQWPAVERAINLRSAVVAGPVNLVQGGLALISRTPIFLARRGEAAGNGSRYWGIASIVVDVDALFESAGLDGTSGAIEYAIRGKDGMGADGDMIRGGAELFDKDAALLPVNLPSGTWQLAGRPLGGWAASSDAATGVRVAGYTMTGLLMALAFTLIMLVRHHRTMAHQDHLTGLANRRLLLKTMSRQISAPPRESDACSVFFVDLNGFKPINDRYGHNFGDAVLIEIARRLREGTRSTDTVARIGGDEFLVLVPGQMNTEQARRIAAKLKAAIETPFEFGKNTVAIGSSIGWASFPEDARTAEELLSLADKRMYGIKQLQRATA